MEEAKKLTASERKAFIDFWRADARRGELLDALQARVAEGEGAIVRAARATLGLNQRDMAARLGMSAPHLNRVEGGKVAAGAALLREIARLLEE